MQHWRCHSPAPAPDRSSVCSVQLKFTAAFRIGDTTAYRLNISLDTSLVEDACCQDSHPISSTGSFNVYATKFFSPGYGFALVWNYWFNDAISVASDLTAAQLVLEFWNIPNPWIFSLTIWVFLVSINTVHVKAYGELGESCSYLISPSFF